MYSRNTADVSFAGETERSTGDPSRSLRPVQCPPVDRAGHPGQGYENHVGADAAFSGCAGLTGVARQMCYAML